MNFDEICQKAIVELKLLKNMLRIAKVKLHKQLKNQKCKTMRKDAKWRDRSALSHERQAESGV
jgi:hypothetical protein